MELLFDIGGDMQRYFGARSCWKCFKCEAVKWEQFRVMKMSAMMIEAKTVEQWLNEVLYSNDVNYVPSKFAMEFINFIKLVNGEDGEEK